MCSCHNHELTDWLNLTGCKRLTVACCPRQQTVRLGCVLHTSACAYSRSPRHHCTSSRQTSRAFTNQRLSQRRSPSSSPATRGPTSRPLPSRSASLRSITRCRPHFHSRSPLVHSLRLTTHVPRQLCLLHRLALHSHRLLQLLHLRLRSMCWRPYSQRRHQLWTSTSSSHSRRAAIMRPLCCVRRAPSGQQNPLRSLLYSTSGVTSRIRKWRSSPTRPPVRQCSYQSWARYSPGSTRPQHRPSRRQCPSPLAELWILLCEMRVFVQINIVSEHFTITL